jgi:hypothetical protein
MWRGAPVFRTDAVGVTGRLAARANVGRHVVAQPEGHLTVASRLDASQRVIVSP